MSQSRPSANIGVVGLAVMGSNLARNLASREGNTVAVYNRSPERTRTLVSEHPEAGFVASESIEQFAASLAKPRTAIVMVQAGKGTDAVIDQLADLFEDGDIIVDGGNANFHDTIRREHALRERGLNFVGAGISGGEEGALNGPSIMPGGSAEAYATLGPILASIAAVAEGEPCVTHVGTDGAGHFVKMIHNGIEYGDMQLICESYALLKQGLGLSNDDFYNVFAEWNRGELDSYLIEITRDIFSAKDPDTGNALVDVILDEAGNKGTGKWMSQLALDLGVPTTLITEAVYARFLSAFKEERVRASKILTGPSGRYQGDKKAFIEAVRQALYASKICSYAQGYFQLQAAAREHKWPLNFGNIALLWRGGCIIRARFLDRIKEAYDADPKLENLLLAPYFTQVIEKSQPDWRKVVIAAIELGVPVPAFTAALTYFDGYRQARLPANLLQAQRDYFGAHTYRRVDKPGVFHSEWLDLRKQPS